MEPKDEREMSLIGHLTELRTRIIISVIAVFVCVCLAFTVANPVLEYLTRPIRRLDREPNRDQELVFHVRPDGSMRVGGQVDVNGVEAPLNLDRLSTQRFLLVFDEDEPSSAAQRSIAIGARPNQGVYYRSPFDAFMVPFKVSLIVGLLLALPILLHQLWLFIKPGLRPAERKVVRSLLAGAIFLFPLGALFAFFMVAMILQVLQSYTPPSIEPLFGINEYLSVLTMMMIVFGVLFELPLFVALAARMGLVTPAMLIHYRRVAYVVLALAAMILTPADPFSMVAALIPLVGLYEVSILVARPMARMHHGDLKEIEADEPAPV